MGDPVAERQAIMYAQVIIERNQWQKLATEQAEKLAAYEKTGVKAKVVKTIASGTHPALKKHKRK